MTTGMDLKETDSKSTPLARALNEASPQAATPLDAFKLARKNFLAGERVSLCALSNELGVSRGKLYRWVGNKELLLDEILWSLARPTFTQIVKETPGTGIEHVVEVHRRFMVATLSYPPLQQFIAFDPPFAVRVITRAVVGAEDRFVKLAADHMAEQAAKGHMRLPAPAEIMAAMVIRSNEALIYNDVISGRSPAIEQACAITRVLLSAGSIPKYGKPEEGDI